MSQKVHYFRIGLFLIIGVLLLVAAIVIFGAGELFDETYAFETYFDESVQGLDVGSFVKYRGVSIGKVKNITIVTDKYDFGDNKEAIYKYNRYVLVEFELDPGSIKQLQSRENMEETLNWLVNREGLRIKIGYLGITGLLYLEIDYVDPLENFPLAIEWEPKFYYIPSAPSPYIRIEQAVTTFSKKFEDEFIPLIQNLNNASTKLSPILDDLQAASENFPSITTDLKGSLGHINDILTVDKGNINETLENLRIISEDLKDFSSELKLNPSRVFMGKPPNKSDIER